ncbi:hypothetical protein, partial [Methylacidimicrobium tartarophylax]|uniref:hypothetical protein n=1 Tax=Methylacidimicrobium tartarophylax TaxID=1041768 RepID=UPI0015B58EAC
EAAEAAREGFSAEASVFLLSTAGVLPEESAPGVAGVRSRLREFHGTIARWVDVWSGMADGVVLPVGRESEAEVSPFAVAGEIEDCHVFAEAGSCLDFSSLPFWESREFGQAAEKADRCLGYIEGSEEGSGRAGELEKRLQDLLPKEARSFFCRRKQARPMQKRLLLLLGRAHSRLPKSKLPEPVREEQIRTQTEVPVPSPIPAAPERELVHSSAESIPFAKTTATLYKGENLDIPAFRRRSGSRTERK